jgi:hypothetical protein
VECSEVCFVVARKANEDASLTSATDNLRVSR